MKLLAIISLAVSLTGYVNPFIGTSNFGATNPGAVVPNGMMSVSPFNVMGSELNTWDKDSRWWSTPYVHENKYFTGYSHVNLSGVGCPDAGSILTIPTGGPLELDYHQYGSEYDQEKAEPGYYTNTLLRSIIRTEATATTRTSIERYTFSPGQGNIILNLGEGLTNESGARLRKVSDTEIEGMKLLGNFCYYSKAAYPVYFVLRVSKAPDKSGFFKKQRPMTAEAEWDKDQGKYRIYSDYDREIAGDDIGFFFSYNALQQAEQICVQIGISFVSIENARENLDKEQHGFDFDKVRKEAHDRWEADLSKIQVEGGTADQRQIFYTALYHALIHPSILNDVNGEYPLMMSSSIGKVEPGHNRYTMFSLWDTCRNVHQLITLLFPDRQLDMVRSMVDMYKEWGWLPRFELFGRETYTMEGDPAIPVIVDTYLKGLKDFDLDAAYEAFVKSANTRGEGNLIRPDIDPYIELGYIPLDYYSQDFSGDNSVSHALEYYVADAAIAVLCNELAKDKNNPKVKDYRRHASLFRSRSLGYRNYYDKETGVLRPKLKDGTFLKPFDPKAGANFSNAPGFHEGSAWNYTLYVPHDIEGYIQTMGGESAYINTIQKVFDQNLYDPANEPDIAYPYLFSYFRGHEWKTQKYVKKILDENYTTKPDGLPGNDDAGTLSCWAVFSMMGFYPDCPGDPYYVITSPIFSKVRISLNPKYFGKSSLEIERRGGNSAKKGYDKVTGISLGGKNVLNHRISHNELISGGKLSIRCSHSGN